MNFNLRYPLPTFLGILLISDLILVSHAGEAACEKKSKEKAATQSRPDSTHGLKLSTPRECARECVEGEPPKNCYYHFTLEFYSTLGGACSLCTRPNDTDSITSDCQCVTADGFERGILTVNRMLPGPSIDVCEGDKIIVDLHNKLIGMETTIHWHGLFQKGTQYYDGVPMVTQCPIPSGTTFRYEFFADNEGTHFWHSHDGTQKMDGIQGKLIVRIPRTKDPNSDLYHYDLTNHEMILSDWLHQLSLEQFPGLINRNAGQDPISSLINGLGRYTDPETNQTTNTSLAQFNVEPGYRYRFRIINSFCSHCPAELIFENHDLVLIAVDGVPVEPVTINTIISFAGERFDVVLTAAQAPRDYWIQVRILGACSGVNIQQLAILHYSGNGYGATLSEQPTFNSSLPNGITLSPLDGKCHYPRYHAICFNQLRSARPVDKKILKGPADFQFFLPAGFFIYKDQQLFKPGTYDHFIVPAGVNKDSAMIDNITYVAPSSPLLSQFDDLTALTFCNATHRPRDCKTPCPCTHVIHIPLGSVCEFILTDGLGIPGISHPFHLHGYAFNVISMGKAPYKNVHRMNSFIARRMQHEGLFHRRFTKPPFKDTVPIPTGGYVILRFTADNPGFWLFHCHFTFHQLGGMEMIVHVGDQNDLPPVPNKFPTCGNFVPPLRYEKY